MDYIAAITDEANAQGIAPAIAVAVARRESGVEHYWRSGPLAGQVKRGKAGEVGIFQIKPSTAPDINLEDPRENIRAGVSELARLWRAFGNWRDALAGYNWHAAEVKAGKPLPAVVQQYVAAVLAMAGPLGAEQSYYRPASGARSARSAVNPALPVGLLVGGLLVLWWLLD